MKLTTKIIIGLSFFIMFLLGWGSWDIRQNNIKSISSGQAHAGILDDIGAAISGHAIDIKNRILVDDELISNGKTLKKSSFKYTKDSIHWAKGDVSIIKYKGKRYIQLHKNFESGLAPDLYLMTSSSKIKTQWDLDNHKKIEIAKLKKSKGATVYEIPKDLKIKSIIIWCKRFNQFMGSAIV